MKKLFVGQILAATALLLETSGPVRVKAQQSESIGSIIAREADERRARNRERLAREAAEAEKVRARTTEAEWARIARDEQRRADKKAAKKAVKNRRLANK